MSVQSSGVIVVEKAPVISNSSTTTSSTSSNINKTPRPIYEFFEPNDGKQKNVMRRHQRTKSSSSSSSSVTPSSASSVQHLKIENFNQMNQQPQQQHPHHSHQPHAHHISLQTTGQHNQLIVSEDYIEAARANNLINYTSTADLLSNTQVIKLVDRNGDDVIFDSMGNLTTSTTQTNGNTHHPNSKMVVGNVTVLSKPYTMTSAGQASQQPNQPQTINFVNAKSLTSGSTSSVGKNQKQNMPSKSNNVTKGSQQHLKNSGSSSKNASNVGAGHAVMSPQQVQKVTLPRNLQLHTVTRVQPAPHPQMSPQHSSSNQIIVQQKYVQSVGGPGQSIKHNNNTNVMKKYGNSSAQSMKGQPHKTSNNHQQGVKTFIQQQSPTQQQYQPIGVHQNQCTPTPTVKSSKSQKSAKHYSNSTINNSTGIVSVATIPSPNSNMSTSGTYTINNKFNSLSTTQPHSTKISKHTNSKYVMQNPLVLPSNSSPLNSNKINNNVTNSIVVNQQLLNSSNNGTIKFVNAHGTVIQQQQQQQMQQQQQLQQQQQQQHLPQLHQIQHQHQTPPSPHPSTTIVPSNNHSHSNKISRSTATNTFSSSSNQLQQTTITQKHQNFVDNNNGKHDNMYHVTSGGYIQNSTTPPIVQHQQLHQQQQQLQQQQQQQLQQQHSQSQQTIGDDIMIVNGTQMTDEFSARILQSMAQKSYNNNRIAQPPTMPKLVQSSPSMPPPNVVAPNCKDFMFYNMRQPYVGPSTPIHPRHSNSESKGRSSDRKHSYENKKYVDIFKVNASDLSQIGNGPNSSIPAACSFLDYIPLPQPLRNDNIYIGNGEDRNVYQIIDQEEEVGKEERPTIMITSDLLKYSNHLVELDHSYAKCVEDMLPSGIVPSSTNSMATITSTSTERTTNGGIELSVSTGQLNYNGSTVIKKMSTSSYNNHSNTYSSINHNLQSVSPHTTDLVAQNNYSLYGHQVCQSTPDDDTHSVISTGYRIDVNDNDFGEETDTAPEAEAEDDSVTRCICDLTHDDGYMICCDKCSAWQHVDCMGIDRQNIPEEYLCEICQPRTVDKTRARSIQLQKRKEQAQIFLNMQLNATGNINILPAIDNIGKENVIQPANETVNAGNVAKKTKRKELLKKEKKEKAAGKPRREPKKASKRKSKNYNVDSAVKYAANLKQWIENYAFAVTNHYSPELRARLHAISKQTNLTDGFEATQNNALKNGGELDTSATIVPHGGGKILISQFDISPNSPIIELRGKYMLTTQFKNQNPSINMNTSHSTNYLQNSKAHLRTPGPFIFFYQLPIDSVSSTSSNSVSTTEICVDTRTYGNEARFVRRSCRPNAVIQHSFVKNSIHLYIVSLTTIHASTEITIKHEPHDLVALDKNASIFPIQPTSTCCACGLTNDCIFGVPPIPAPAIGEKARTVSGSQKQSETEGNISTLANGETIEDNNDIDNLTIDKTKDIKNNNRFRSTSSSGDSNIGLLSPNNNNIKTNLTHTMYNSAASIVSLMHDSGVYTSSSSPSVSIPSPTHNLVISSPSQQQQNPQPPQQQNLQLQKPPLLSTIQLPLQSPIPIPAILTPSAETDVEKHILPETPESVDIPKEIILTPVIPEQKNTSIVSAEETTVIAANKELDNQDVEKSLAEPEIKKETIAENQIEEKPIPQLSPTPPAPIQKPTSQNRKSQAKARGTSVSMDVDSNSQLTTNIVANATTSDATGSTNKDDNRKMTREERKMEAIVRAFAKMEKNQQRKQAKSTSASGSKRGNSSSPTPKRVKLSSVSDSGDMVSPLSQNTPPARKKAPPRRKKRRAQKSYNSKIPVNQRKRRKLRDNSQESDGITSEESSSILSPANDQKNQNDSTVNQAAGLLLALANPDKSNFIQTNDADSNHASQPSSSQTQPTVESSVVCMLVEAAVGPLSNLDNDEFKPPAKTKTKKSLMSNWLNQSGDFHNVNVRDSESPEILEYNTPQIKIDRSVLSSPVDIGNVSCKASSKVIDNQQNNNTSSPLFMATQTSNNNSNLSIVAKKVEEFLNINQTDMTKPPNHNDCLGKEGSIKVKPLSSLTLPLQISTCSNNSSVKKRWLRQAISEEVDENSTTTPLSSSPTSQHGPSANGFSTPLKKRRLLIKILKDSGEESSTEDLLGFSKSGSDSGLSNDEKCDDYKDDLKKRTQDEVRAKTTFNCIIQDQGRDREERKTDQNIEIARKGLNDHEQKQEKEPEIQPELESHLESHRYECEPEEEAENNVESEPENEHSHEVEPEPEHEEESEQKVENELQKIKDLEQKQIKDFEHDQESEQLLTLERKLEQELNLIHNSEQDIKYEEEQRRKAELIYGPEVQKQRTEQKMEIEQKQGFEKKLEIEQTQDLYQILESEPKLEREQKEEQELEHITKSKLNPKFEPEFDGKSELVSKQKKVQIETHDQIISDVEMEVDILRSPSPGPKLAAEDNLAKIEPEDKNAALITVNIETDESMGEKIEHSNDTSVSRNTKEKFTFGTDIGYSDYSLNHYAKNYKAESTIVAKDKRIDEDEPECKTFKLSKPNQQFSIDDNDDLDNPFEEFDSIHPSIRFSEQISLNLPSITKCENEPIADEIADIQKKLHSFHKENILILQSRNKKSKPNPVPCELSTAITPEARVKSSSKKSKKDKKSSLEKRDSSRKTKSHKKAGKKKHRSSKKRQLNFDDVSGDFQNNEKIEIKLRASPLSQKDNRRFSIDESLTDAKIDVLPLDDKIFQAALTIPSFNQNVLQPTLFSSYLNSAQNSTLQNSTITDNTQYSQNSLQISSSFMTTVYNKYKESNIESVAMPDLKSTVNLTSQHYPEGFESRKDSYSTLGGYHQHPAFFGLNVTKTPEPISGISTGYESTSSHTTPATTPSKISPNKIIAKTSICDPRLNPSLTAKPTPKKKLSINEYRKRKLQSTETSCRSSEIELMKNSSSFAISSTIPSSASLISREICDIAERSDFSSGNESLSSNNTILFNSAPTLLEKQQESLCERLKSLKNKNANFSKVTTSGLCLSTIDSDVVHFTNSNVNNYTTTDNSSMNGSGLESNRNQIKVYKPFVLEDFDDEPLSFIDD